MKSVVRTYASVASIGDAIAFSNVPTIITPTTYAAINTREDSVKENGINMLIKYDTIEDAVCVLCINNFGVMSWQNPNKVACLDATQQKIYDNFEFPKISVVNFIYSLFCCGGRSSHRINKQITLNFVNYWVSTKKPIPFVDHTTIMNIKNICIDYGVVYYIDEIMDFATINAQDTQGQKKKRKRRRRGVAGGGASAIVDTLDDTLDDTPNNDDNDVSSALDVEAVVDVIDKIANVPDEVAYLRQMLLYMKYEMNLRVFNGEGVSWPFNNPRLF